MSFRFNLLFSVLCLAAVGTTSSSAIAQDQGSIPGIKPAVVATELSEEEMIKKASIILVYNRLGQMMVQLKADGIELDQEQALEGARRAIAGEPIGVSMDDAQTIMNTLQKRAQKAQQKRREEMMVKMKALAEKNKADETAYFAENAKKPGVQTLDGGVQYEVMVEGSGPKPKLTDEVKINYHGMFIDGTVFDSTVEPPRGQEAKPSVVPLSAFAVEGFKTALLAMPVGSKWKVSIPADVAYKMGGQLMEPNKTLIFEIELLEIIPADFAPAGNAAPAATQGK